MSDCSHGHQWRSQCWRCRREDEMGDKSKQPPNCKPELWSANPCQNLKERDDNSMAGETYRCETCGAGFFLDYEEMK